ncbi:glycosyl hydrolase family 18 protein [Paenibacillus thiaminolyticus]|uniref:glycosyl hydrolase family 18 protein n=1 Tax=Paenibacillus thiaminolyticus TaxID=49283 RepID=UPI003D2AB635
MKTLKWGRLRGMLALLLSIVMVLSSAAAASAAPARVQDIDGHWAEKTMTEWKKKGLIYGYADGSMQPNRAVSRAEFAALVNRAFQFTAMGDIPFADVAASSWEYDEVRKAVMAGFAAGFPDGTFRPALPVSRQEAAVMLNRLLPADGPKGDLTSFTDHQEIASWARDAVSVMVAAGWFAGYLDDTIRPKAKMTRAEAVIFLDRALQSKLRGGEEQPESGKGTEKENDKEKEGDNKKAPVATAPSSSGGSSSSGGGSGGGSASPGDSSAPGAPIVTGVSEGQTYTIGVVPAWKAESGTTVSATLNGAAYAKGTAIKEAGEYVLIVTAIKASNGKQASTTVRFKVEESKRLIAYVPGWVDWSEANPIDASKLTHIYYAFAHIKDGKITHIPDQNDEENLAYFNQLKAQNPHLRVLISIGGWGADGFSDAALTDESRAAFAESAMAWVEQYQLDGVDLDWEYPTQSPDGVVKGRPEDKQNFTLLLEEFRKQLDVKGTADGKYYELAIAVGSTQTYVNGVEIEKIHPYLDSMMLMTYDYSGGWMNTTAHHTNLYGAGLSGDATVKLYLSNGVPAAKLVLGAAFYAHMWTDVQSTENNGLGQRAAPSWLTPSYKEVLTEYTVTSSTYGKLAYTRYWDEAAQAPYLFDGNTWLTYDDPDSAAAKGNYVLEQELGGVMLWEYSHDPSGVLVDALYQSLRGAYQSDTTVPDAPAVTGVEHGQTYTGPVAADWADEPGTFRVGKLNDEPYLRGTAISEPGNYVLVVASVHLRSGKAVTTTIEFTVE